MVSIGGSLRPWASRERQLQFLVLEHTYHLPTLGLCHPLGLLYSLAWITHSLTPRAPLLSTGGVTRRPTTKHRDSAFPTPDPRIRPYTMVCEGSWPLSISSLHACLLMGSFLWRPSSVIQSCCRFVVEIAMHRLEEEISQPFILIPGSSSISLKTQMGRCNCHFSTNYPLYIPIAAPSSLSTLHTAPTLCPHPFSIPDKCHFLTAEHSIVFILGN